MDSVILSAYFSSSAISAGPHYHSCHEVLYVTGGSADIAINGKNFRIGPGDLVILSRFEQHSVNSASRDYQRYVLKVTPCLNCSSPESYRLFSLLFNRPDRFHNILEFRECAIGGLFEKITAEFASRLPMQEEMMNLMLQELLIMIFRRYTGLMEPVLPEFLDVIRQVQTRFESGYGEEYSLSQLAGEYSVSPSHLSHQFRKITGQSVMGYLLACRIAAAKDSLCRTQMPVGQIAEQCGFRDASNFSRTFREQTGFSPTDFRHRYETETP